MRAKRIKTIELEKAAMAIVLSSAFNNEWKENDITLNNKARTAKAPNSPNVANASKNMPAAFSEWLFHKTVPFNPISLNFKKSALNVPTPEPKIAFSLMLCFAISQEAALEIYASGGSVTFIRFKLLTIKIMDKIKDLPK